jgi:hypothetical protein
MRRCIALGMLVAVTAFTGGCGDDTEAQEKDLRGKISVLTEASKQGDGNKICDELFTPSLKESVSNASGRPCSAEVTDKLFSPKATFSVTQLTLNGDNASARVVDQFKKTSLIVFVKRDDDWKIAGVIPAGKAP